MSRNLQGRRGQTASKYLYATNRMSSAINHRTWKTGLPVRSAVLKPCAGRLVVGWVTTSEYLLLIVFAFLGGEFLGIWVEQRSPKPTERGKRHNMALFGLKRDGAGICLEPRTLKGVSWVSPSNADE